MICPNCGTENKDTNIRCEVCSNQLIDINNTKYQGNLPNIGMVALIAAFAGVLLNLILRIVSGTFGDLFYKKRVISQVAELKNSNENDAENLRRKGGISFTAVLIGIMAVQYLPSIMAMFAGIL